MYTELLKEIKYHLFFYQNSEFVCFFVHILIDRTIKYVNKMRTS